jgi:hypothetical protein
MYQLLTNNKDRKNENELNFLENQHLNDLANLKNETENMRKR